MEGRIELIETDVRLMLKDIRSLKGPSEFQFPHHPQPPVKGFGKD